MAEFVKVMSEMARICGLHDKCRDGCAVQDYCGTAMENRNEKLLKDTEKAVLDWAKAHPRFPTWQEWWEETFPEAVKAGKTVCPGHFGAVGNGTDPCRGKQCDDCVAEEMPEDFARRLGVKAKEE